MMSFAGLTFLFRFLPIFLIVYYLVPSKYRNIVLLTGSIVFYALGEPVFILLLIGLTVVNHLLGRAAWKLKEGFELREWQKKQRKRYFLIAVILDVMVLVLFKTLSVVVSVKLFPLGLSFYLFKMISYQIDLYRDEITGKPSFLDTAVYFMLFPQIEQGPIMRYEDGRVYAERRYSLQTFEEGLKYFILGLSMKLLLADRLAILWKDLQMIGFQSISTPLAWLGAFGYSLQLYFDFWGYSLMASGIMVMLGFEFIENFDHPYASRSISEFYRRWHMTLGSWFRDYVYFPLGGSRCRKSKLCFNLALVWILTGIWHGNGWNFVIWGAVLGVFIIMEKLFLGNIFKKYPILGNIYVIILIPLTWVIFAIQNMGDLGVYFSRLFPLFGAGEGVVNPLDFIQYLQNYGIFFGIGILLCIPFFYRFFDEHKHNIFINVLLIVLFWGCIYFASSSAGNPFMYLNF